MTATAEAATPRAETEPAPPHEAAKAPGEARLPVAFLAALAILLIIELIVRAMPLHVMVRYGQGDLAKDAVVAYVHDDGATEVAFVGTSMARDGIAASVVRGELEKGGVDASVGNFAVRGGSPDDDALIVQRLLAAPRPPQLIVIGVAPIDFLDREPSWEWLAEYWTPADWWHAYRRDRGHDAAAVRPYFGQSCRNWLALKYRTLRYRKRIIELAGRPSAARVPASAHPILGEPYVPRASLIANKSYGPKQVQRHLEDILRDRQYPMGERLPSELAETLRACRAAGVDAVLVEMPLSKMMRYELPAGTMERFYALARMTAAAGGTQFVTVEEIGFAPRDDRFFNAQHLNWLGRARYSTAVAEAVVLPRLRQRAAPSR